jgi:hypothetical protein
VAPGDDDRDNEVERPWLFGWALFAIVIILLATLVFGW